MDFTLYPRTVFLTLSGSHAYGMATATSDYDYRGIAIPPMSHYIGLVGKFEQVVDNEKNKHVYTHYPVGFLQSDPRVPGNDPNNSPDMQVMELTKFVRLAINNNPSVLETLFTEESEWVVSLPIMKPLIDNREKLLSKMVKSSFCGYAVSQLNRAKRHRRWLLSPPSHKPTREEFGLPEHMLLSKDQLGAANALIQRELDEFMIDQTHLPPDVKIELPLFLGKSMRAIWNAINTEAFPVGEGARFESIEDAMCWGAALDQDFSENFLEILVREKRYRTALQEWNQYQTWLAQRNPARAELEAKFGYDCYAVDTEFLTDKGWKLFDDISDNDKLATVNLSKYAHRTFLGVEYQSFVDKFDGVINSGYLYHLFGSHTDTLVTPNHRMLFQKVERRSGKEYGLVLEEAAHLPDTFEVLIAPEPNKKNYSDKDCFAGLPLLPQTYMMIMGWYLSDGCMELSDGKIKSIRISQKKHGKLYSNMVKFQNKWGNVANSSLYEYTRQPNSFNPHSIQEMTLSIRNKEIVNRILKDCGNLKEKRIPRWVFGLSKRLMHILLMALHLGDGTDSRPDNSKIYYSSLKGLADDVQELALLCGYETSLYGPYQYDRKDGYELTMYQVHFNMTRDRFKKCYRSKNIEKVLVKTPQRIVCFTVPNGTLITRRNGHIGIHGNSKNVSHLVRLLLTCRQILETGKLVVKRPDADLLLEIRRGAWTYEQVIEFSEKEDAELSELVKVCALPKVPDMNFFDKIVREMILEFNAS